MKKKKKTELLLSLWINTFFATGLELDPKPAAWFKLIINVL